MTSVAFVAFCRDELGLAIEGLMCIPPADENPGPHFALLAKLAARRASRSCRWACPATTRRRSPSARPACGSASRDLRRRADGARSPCRSTGRLICSTGSSPWSGFPARGSLLFSAGGAVIVAA